MSDRLFAEKVLLHPQDFTFTPRILTEMLVVILGLLGCAVLTAHAPSFLGMNPSRPESVLESARSRTWGIRAPGTDRSPLVTARLDESLRRH